jgi:hypothetical protein
MMLVTKLVHVFGIKQWQSFCPTFLMNLQKETNDGARTEERHMSCLASEEMDGPADDALLLT